MSESDGPPESGNPIPPAPYPYGTPPSPPGPAANPYGTPPDLTKPAYGDTAPYQQPQYPNPAYPQPPQPPQPPYGGAPGYPVAYQMAPPNEGLGLAAMIIGIASLVLACLYGIGLLGAPVALVMGRVSIKRIDRSNGTLGGRGMAMAGFVLGIIGSVLLVLALIVVIVLVIAAANGAFDDSGTYDYGLG